MESSISDSELILLITIGIVVMILLVLAFVLFFVLSQRKLDSERQHNQEQKLIHQEQLISRGVEFREEERRSIAKDIHDDICSKLNVALLGLHQLQKTAALQPPEAALEVANLLRSTIDSARQISHNLFPPTLEAFGLNAAIGELCDTYTLADTVHIEFDSVPGQRCKLPKIAELSIFRALQEFISNSIRHGQARNIHIQLACSPEGIDFSYRCDGLGFDPSHQAFKPGLGLLSVETRMKMIGADYKYSSSPGAGFFAQIRYKPVPAI